MTVFLAYDRAAADGDLAAQDVFAQLDAVEAALAEAGRATQRLPVGLDLAAVKPPLTSGPHAVFNLVESIDNADRLQALFAMALEEWRVPFTGSGSQAMVLANHKVLSKKILAAAGAAVPACCWLGAGGGLRSFPGTGAFAEGAWIVKPLEMHASLHIDDGSVGIFSCPDALADQLRSRRDRHGLAFFAERFIEGREFNISLLENDGEITVLPPAEIEFTGFPPDKPKIVGYAAKWDDVSMEYRNTRRAFGTLDGEGELARRLAGLSLAAWEAFGLAGYARVDFRVDPDGRPFILEANANPCLAPDAGFAAAALEGGWEFGALCRGILAAATSGRTPRRSP